MSTDELTGVQALERKHPGLPLAPGKVERREFEYIRHGTRSFIISRDVVTGQIALWGAQTYRSGLSAACGGCASDRAAQRWHFVVDNLDTHRSESLVRWVARGLGWTWSWVRRASGTLATESPGPHFSGSHCIALHPQAIMDEPSGNLAEHCYSGVIQIGNLLLDFIDYNRTMAKPFKWTYQGKVLVA